MVYVDDDLFTRLSHVAIWNTRQVEFGKEMPYAGRLSYGGTIVGPPADTTWLRITHRVDPATASTSCGPGAAATAAAGCVAASGPCPPAPTSGSAWSRTAARTPWRPREFDWFRTYR